MFTNEPDEIPNEGPSPHLVMENIDVTTSGITSLLKNLDVHKASGPDDISARFLKETAEVVAPVLKVIFERSLDTGDVPYDWRVANVAPVYKKGRQSAPRTIIQSHLHLQFAKIFRIYHIFSIDETLHLLHEFQHEFQRSKSCDMQLISFLQEIMIVGSKLMLY